MSVWSGYDQFSAPPPGTPNLEIRLTPADGHQLLADGKPVYSAPAYYDCHRQAQNMYGLTSTQMLPVYADYERSLPPEVQVLHLGEQASTSASSAEGSAEVVPNKYRKQSS